MSSSQRFEDVLPRWRRECREKIARMAVTVAVEATAGFSNRQYVDIHDPLQQSRLVLEVNQKVTDFVASDLLPSALKFDVADGRATSEPATTRAQTEMSNALRQLLPKVELRWPESTLSVSLTARATSAAVGAVLGTLVFVPASLLVLGQREPGLLVGGAVGSGMMVALMAWLSERPEILDSLQKLTGAAGTLAVLGGFLKLFRQVRMLRGAVWMLGCVLLLVLARPRPRLPSTALCRESIRIDVESYLTRAVDLVLAICWTHPGNDETSNVLHETKTSLSNPLTNALGVLHSVMDEQAPPENVLRSAARAVLQRVYAEGYQWQGLPSGARYEAGLAERFECFNEIAVGEEVEILELALVRHGKLVKPGILRSI